MAIMDTVWKFSTDQALGASPATVISADVNNLGAAKKPFEGVDTKLKLVVTVSAGGGTDHTLALKFIGDSAANLAGSPITLAEMAAVTLATTAVPATFEFPINRQTTAKQYYGVSYTQAGTGTLAFVVDAYLAEVSHNPLVP
jgi:hypothetical protein